MAEVWINSVRGRLRLEPNRILSELDDAQSTVVVNGGDVRRPPRLDGRSMLRINDFPLTFTAEAALGGDAGYHEVLVYSTDSPVPEPFAFCTRKGTRRAMLLREMADMVERVGWTTRTLFLEGAIGDQRLRVPGVILGWMLERVPLIIQDAAKILGRPIHATVAQREQRPYAQHLDLGATLDFLRGHPQALTHRVAGAVSIGANRYTPEIVIAQEPVRTEDTPEHRLARYFLEWMHSELRGMDDAGRLGPYRDLAAQWMADFGTLLRHPMWRSVSRPQRGELGQRPTALQRYDRRYRLLYTTYAEYRGLRTYVPADDNMRTLLEEPEKIFEAFAASVIAAAWGMTPCGPTIRDRRNGASFEGSGRRLFYDVKPPAALLRSWREETDYPDRDRPDVLLADGEGRTALLDAKFKDYSDGGDLTHDIQEMQAYQHSYGIRKSALLTPYGRRRDIVGGGYTIKVIPVRPVPPDQLDALMTYIREVTEDLFVKPVAGSPA